MNKQEKIAKILGTIEELPAMPGVVGKMLSLIDDPDVSYHDLIMNLDVALSAKLLKVANSAYYRTYQSIQSLEHAFAVLGLDSVKNMLVGISVAGILGGDSVQNSSFDYKKFWRQSVLTAQFSRILAKLIHYPELSKIYTIGLIHDIGGLLIAIHFPENYGELVDLIDKKRMNVCEAESMVIGMPHCQIGALMAEKWKLSPEMAEAIKFHNTPEKLKEHSETYKIASIIQTAEKIIDETGLDFAESMVEKAQLINSHICKLVRDTSAHLQEQKVLSEWSSIVFSEMDSMEEELSLVLGTLLKT